MPITSLAVIIGGICAALTLIAAAGRSLFKAVASSQLNAKNLGDLNDQTQQQDVTLDQHETRITVLEDRDRRDSADDARDRQQDAELGEHEVRIAVLEDHDDSTN